MTEETSERLYVLDASALLCVMFGEPGAERVEERLTRALVSAVNYHEVFAKLVDRGVDAEEAKTMLGDLDIDIIEVDREQADLGGALRAHTRKAGLSLGDRTCLALAQSKGAVAVTTDHAWRELDVDIEVEVVR
ncbi:type II toxin-antitoxin system VapC family toxin [Sphingomonas sp. TX0543]|uniref:type II toxin-antitoxin system VapC family toxin n=1 Tax=unclassified Sphingomonas TaxID=196159 RepID=UPI00381B9F4A